MPSKVQKDRSGQGGCKLHAGQMPVGKQDKKESNDEFSCENVILSQEIS
jgi:hypothetical protein